MIAAHGAPAAERDERHAAPARRGGVVAVLAVAALFALVTPWVLRPWFLARDAFPRAASGLGAMIDADLYLNVWILAWIAHALLTDPARLFDGNIYFPASNTITGSENMLAHVPVTVPALAATGNALVVLKAMALESFILAGIGMFFFVRHHTRSTAAGLVAGAAFTFAPWRPNTLPQPQYLGTAYLPLALLAVDCWLEGRRPRAVAGIATAMALQGLACVYLGYFAFIAVPIYAVARVALGRWPRRVQALAGVAAGLTAGALALVPAALPYLHDRAQHIIPVQDVGTVVAFAWQPATYLRPEVLFGWIGIVPVAGAVVGLVARALRRPAAGMPIGALWTVAGAAFLLSAGPYLALPGDHAVPLPYLLFYRLVPGFSSMRAPARFFIVVAMALSALTGFAFARFTAGRRPAVRGVLALVVALACAVSAAPRPAPTVPAQLGASTPPVYRWLAAQPAGGALLEIPGRRMMGDIGGQLREARHMVASTTHWHPLIGGYTAYAPPSAAFLTSIVQRLPDPEAFAVLVDAVDVRWIVVHEAELPPPLRGRWGGLASEGLVHVGRFAQDDAYAVRREPAHGWRDQIVPRSLAPARNTLEGTSTAPLAASCRQARILDVAAPRSILPSPDAFAIPVRFANDSACTWPGIGVRPEGLVGLGYTWTSPSGRVYASDAFSRLLHDVAPGAVVEAPLFVFPGGEFGTWSLEVRLVQNGTTEPLATKTVPVELEQWKLPPPPPPPPRAG